MKSFKNHLSVIFPLVVFLISLQFTINLEKIVDDYEDKLVEDYSIVMVSSGDLNVSQLKIGMGGLRSLELMSTDKVLDKLKGDLSSKNISLLKTALPKFYSLKLSNFPSTAKLLEIKKQLLKHQSISRVETFSKTHDKIYRIFTIAKFTSYIFTIFILIISFLLMLKQMRIWVYEHKERMDIMSLFGAPFWMKSTFLYRLVIVDSIIATCIVIFVYDFISTRDFMQSIASDMEIVIPSISISSEGLFLFLVALISSIFSVSLVMLRLRKG